MTSQVNIRKFGS